MNRFFFFLVIYGTANGLSAQTIFGNYLLPAGAVPEKNSFIFINLSKDSSFNGFWCFDKKENKADIAIISGKFVPTEDRKSVKLLSKQMLVVDDMLATLNNGSLSIIGISPNSQVANHTLFLESPTIIEKKFLLSQINHPNFGEFPIDFINSFSLFFATSGNIVRGTCGCKTFSAKYSYNTQGKLSFNNVASSANTCGSADEQSIALFLKMLKKTNWYEFDIQTGILKLYDKRKKLLLTFSRNLF